MFKKKTKKEVVETTEEISKPDFSHLNTPEAARNFLVDNFPGTTIEGWKWKGTDEKDQMSVRVFEGPMKLSAAVIFNPNALEEKFALVLDTSGNYDIGKYDPSTFQNKEMTEEEAIEKLMGHTRPKKDEEKEEEPDTAKKQKKIKKPRLTKKEKEMLDKATQDIMTEHNLGVLNVQIILKQSSMEKRQEIQDTLDTAGVTYVLFETTQQLLHGSDEFSAINSKEQEKVTTLGVECLVDDVQMIRMQIGEYIAAIYRKV